MKSCLQFLPLHHNTENKIVIDSDNNTSAIISNILLIIALVLLSLSMTILFSVLCCSGRNCKQDFTCFLANVAGKIT